MATSLQKPFACLLILSITISASISFFVTTPNCGRALYTRSETFSSPFYNQVNGFPNMSESCEWRITGGTEEKIIINITDIDIIKSPDCTFGSIEVRDGYWYSSPLLARVCGYGQLDPITSTGNKMYISYNFNNPNGHRGFIANYESVCGGDLFVYNTTELSTPGYPKEYPLNRKCIWRIVVPENRKAVFTFRSFDIEFETHCRYDFVEIRNGLNETSNLIGKYCNLRTRSAEIPIQIMSDTNYLFVKFVSDISVRRGGFLATIETDYDECENREDSCAQICVNIYGGYRCACRSGYELHSNGKDCEVACGGTLNGTNGTIRSPSYPDVYPLNRTCTWDIVTKPNYLIKINFTHFDIEDGSNETECDKDRLEIYNRAGSDNDNIALEGIYCGQMPPQPIVFRTNTTRLVFSSDSNVQKTGFLLNYFVGLDLCSVNNGNCLHGCVSSIERANCQCLSNYILQSNHRDCAKSNCHFEIASASGNVSSPNYPNSYPNNVNCDWAFRTTPGHRLSIVFRSFSMESHSSCVFDSLTFYDGSSRNNAFLGKFCNSFPNPVYSTTNNLYMVFTTDGSNTFGGFLATYSSVCGGHLQATDQEQYIYSHVDYGYANYSNNVSCQWNVTAPSGKVVSLLFSTFRLESNCQNDHVDVFDGTNTSVPTSFCGTTIPSPQVLSTNLAKIIFLSNSAVTDKGFSIIYKAVNAVGAGTEPPTV